MTGGPLVSRRLLLNQENLHLINTELKSIVILIKDTGLDSPPYSSAPESGLGFNFIWFTVSGGSTPIWIVCSDAGLTFHKAVLLPPAPSHQVLILQSLHVIDLVVAYLAMAIGFVSSQERGS